MSTEEDNQDVRSLETKLCEEHLKKPGEENMTAIFKYLNGCRMDNRANLFSVAPERRTKSN